MLQMRDLGNTGIKVTELCFGVLPLGPLQKNLGADESVGLMAEAIREGINFFDTAEMYETQEYVGAAMDRTGRDVVVATKSTAESYEDMRASVERSRRELGRDYIDIYHLHAARAGEEVFQERAGALKCLAEYREQGRIGAVGISTHNVMVVEQAASQPEIEVVFPLINQLGRGLLGGGLEEMKAAMARASGAGKGVYAMKALAGGHLLERRREAIDFVRQLPGNHATSLGMVNRQELQYNLAHFRGETISQQMESAVPKTSKRVHIAGFCTRCGSCVQTCPNAALALGEEKAQVDHERCVLCGYCSPVCPEFAIRLV